MSVVLKARDFATKAHGAQVRKFTNEPYMVHPIRVAHRLTKERFPDHVVAAAMMHDVLEDTPVKYHHIEHEFGPHIAKLVNEVTNISRKSDGNRAVRKAIDRAHLAGSSHYGASIKLSDLLDNSQDIMKHDKSFAKVYLPEASKLLEVLKHGHTGMWNELHARLAESPDGGHREPTKVSRSKAHIYD